MMWWWTKIKKANIDPDVRRTLERLGESVVTQAVALGTETLPLGVFSGFSFTANRLSILDWLTERRQTAQRAEQRMETVEWAVLIFVVVGTITEIVTLFADLAVLHHVS